MCHRGVSFLDVILPIEILKLYDVELGPIIGYNDFWNPKSTYNILNDKGDHSLGCDRGQRLCFYPFSKIIHGHNSELCSALCYGKAPNNVNSPHSKRPRACHCLQLARWRPRNLGEFMASITISCILGYILVYGRPKIAISQYLLCQRFPPV